MQTIDTNRQSKCFQVLYEDLTTVAKTSLTQQATHQLILGAPGAVPIFQHPSLSRSKTQLVENDSASASTKPWKPSTKQPETSTEFSDVFAS